MNKIYKINEDLDTCLFGFEVEKNITRKQLIKYLKGFIRFNEVQI